MRILEIGAGDFFSTYGGGQVYVKNLVDELIRQGEDVAVVSFISGVDGIRQQDYSGHDLYEVSDEASLKKAIELVNPDVIHAHSHKGASCVIGKVLGVPVVVTAHHGGIVCPAGTLLTCDDKICDVRVNHSKCLRCVLRNIRTGLWWYPLMSLMPHRAYLSLGRWLSKKPFVPFVTPIGGCALSIEKKQTEWKQIVNGCAMMIAPCQRLADSLVLNGFPVERMQIVTHGIPLPKQVPPFPVVKNGGVKFFYVGRICYVKGLHTLIKAFMQMRQPNAELHLIGGTGNKQEVIYERHLRKMSQNDSRIIWHGKVAPSEVFNMIRNFHISSSSAFLEAFGLNIAESLAMGKPVLATRSGGAEQQITDGVNGWLVDSEDIEAMSSKMQEICDTLVTFDTTKATSTVKSLKQHAEELIEIYKQTIR